MLQELQAYGAIRVTAHDVVSVVSLQRRCSSRCCNSWQHCSAAMASVAANFFVFFIQQLQEFSTTSSYVFMREREKKKSEKEKKRESFEICSKIHHSSFGLILPSSFDLGVAGW